MMNRRGKKKRNLDLSFAQNYVVQSVNDNQNGTHKSSGRGLHG